MIAFCESWNGRYIPAKESLKIPALKTLYVESQKVNEEVDKLIPPVKSASIALEAVFNRLNPLITRIANIFRSGNSKEAAVPLNAAVKKLKGIRSSAKPDAEEQKKMEEEGRKTRSSSRMGKDSRTETYRQLLFLLNEGVYEPNEKELTKVELQKILKELEDGDSALMASELALNNARNRRDEILYKADTGLVEIAQQAKTYIKGAFGPSSPEYKSVAKLTFRRQYKY